jgi:hypothetical protein
MNLKEKFFPEKPWVKSFLEFSRGGIDNFVLACEMRYLARKLVHA